jgi:hypothetical protein
VALQASLSDFGLSEDPDHPVRTVLAHKFVEHFTVGFVSLLEARELTRGPHFDKQVQTKFKELISRSRESGQHANEIADWIYTNRWPASDEQAFAMAQRYSSITSPKELYETLRKRPVGRPNTEKHTFVEVFELMLAGSHVSLGRARSMVHPPLSLADEPRLKDGIRRLKKLLQAIAPELLSKYESLHPDRAKKVNG